MSKRPRRNHAPASRRRWPWPRSRARRPWLNWRSNSMCILTKLPSGKRSSLEGAVGVFGAEARSEAVAPTVDLKSLHAKIGELTLENDFLEGALSKAGMLSAKR